MKHTTNYISLVFPAAAAFAIAVCFSTPSSAVSLVPSVRTYYASGPVSVLRGQNAEACTTNLDESPVSVLIALFTADTGSLLASKEEILQRGMGTCLDYQLGTTQGDLQQTSRNIVGIIVEHGIIVQGGIQQIGPGGSCLVASLQVQTLTPANTFQTVLYVPTPRYTMSQRDRD